MRFTTQFLRLIDLSGDTPLPIARPGEPAIPRTFFCRAVLSFEFDSVKAPRISALVISNASCAARVTKNASSSSLKRRICDC